MNKLPYLNLGCGHTYHKSWVNVDFVSSDPEIIGHNLLKGIPFNDSTFEVVYHSHVLEHFQKDKALALIKECYRVLKPGGLIRVAVPDLERIARIYLKYLEESLNKVPLAEQKYEWTLLEMYDQVVRTKSGGDMLNYLVDSGKGNDAFILERNGNEAEELLSVIRSDSGRNNETVQEQKISFKTKLKNMLLRRWFGEDYKQILEAAVFRSQGEIHQWMYDRFSLGQLLEKCGFSEVKVVTAFESSVKEWESYELDGKNGKVRKPDSLFMEARK